MVEFKVQYQKLLLTEKGKISAHSTEASFKCRRVQGGRQNNKMSIE